MSAPAQQHGEGPAAGALRRIAEELRGSPHGISAADLEVLEAACGGDEDRCNRWI
jgi:hypothetical protein